MLFGQDQILAKKQGAHVPPQSGFDSSQTGFSFIIIDFEILKLFHINAFFIQCMCIYVCIYIYSHTLTKVSNGLKVKPNPQAFHHIIIMKPAMKRLKSLT